MATCNRGSEIRLIPLTQKSNFLLSSVTALLVLGGCSNRPTSTENPTPAGPRITSESVVKASADITEVPVGGFGDAIVKVTVQNGYHINANPASFPYLIPTELDIPDTDEISINNTFYPSGLVKKFSFAKDDPLSVYEGETQLKVALEAAKTAGKGQRSLPGTLRIQACDDRVCYPPGSIAISLPVVIK